MPLCAAERLIGNFQIKMYILNRKGLIKNVGPRWLIF